MDRAATLSSRRLKRTLERAEIARVLDVEALKRALEDANGKRGTGTLRHLIAAFSEPPPTKDELENRFIEVVERAGLATPRVNAWIGDKEVDFHWPVQKLIVETDGRETHATAAAFERDRQRDLELALDGWRVIRITWRQLRDQPQRVAALLKRKLA